MVHILVQLLSGRNIQNLPKTFQGDDIHHTKSGDRTVEHSPELVTVYVLVLCNHLPTNNVKSLMQPRVKTCPCCTKKTNQQTKHHANHPSFHTTQPPCRHPPKHTLKHHPSCAPILLNLWRCWKSCRRNLTPVKIEGRKHILYPFSHNHEETKIGGTRFPLPWFWKEGYI